MESSRLIGIKPYYNDGEIKAVIRKAVKLNGSNDSYVRLTLWKSEGRDGILIIVREYSPYPLKKYLAGLRACVSKFRQGENSFLSGIKTTSRVILELAYACAKEKRFDEAIILNNRGYIAEASRSNIFFVKGNELFTPSLACGCLKGITRQVIFDLAGKYNIRVNEGEFTPGDLYNAEEVFLTNSLMGVIPLVSVEKISIGRDALLTRFFINKYNSLKA
jgi:branched-subunit amino acid aminotransferase/4-amino-4-deoxychorismate lyase